MQHLPHLPRPTCDAIVVMGKLYPPGGGPYELVARSALAALIWQHSPANTLLMCMEGYDHPDRTRSGADVFREAVLQSGVPAALVVARGLANCTAREVEYIREALRDYGRAHPLVITHPYHVPRTWRYLHAVGVAAQVIGCTPALARRFPAASERLDLLRLVEHGEPGLLNTTRERLVELLLMTLHTVDPPGTIERRLSDWIRGGDAVSYAPHRD